MAKGPEAVDFFDEDDAPDESPRGEPREPIRGGGGPPRAEAVTSVRRPTGSRRGSARLRLLLGAIVFLILIVIAFRGCLDARKDRSYQNYVSDLSSITAETEQLSTNFFERFKGGASDSSGDIGFDTEVEGDKGTSQGLLDRAEGLDAPGDIEGAQEQIVLSFELRHDALEGIAAQLQNLSAGGKQAEKAGSAIYTQMKVFSASDILYARAQDQIEQALVDQDVVVDDGVPDSQFLPDDPNYLDPAVTADALGGVSTGGTASDTACKDDGLVHGLGLVDAVDPAALRHRADQRRNLHGRRGRRHDRGLGPEPGRRRREQHRRHVTGDNGIDASGSIDSIAAGETQTVDDQARPGPEGRRQRHARRRRRDGGLRAGRRQQQGHLHRRFLIPSRGRGLGWPRPPRRA